MSVRTLAAAGLLVSASWIGLSTAAPAYALCEPYSGGCATPPPTSGGGGGTDQPIGGGTEQPGTGNPGTDAPGTENPGTGTGGGPGTPAGPKANVPTGGTTSNPAALPFTGGELVLMTAVGAGALAGGTALVLAGRRKAQPAV